MLRKRSKHFILQSRTTHGTTVTLGNWAQLIKAAEVPVMDDAEINCAQAETGNGP
jgi:hypothetical protein